MNWPEIRQRFALTMLYAVLGVVAASTVLDAAVVKAAGMAALMAAFTFASLVARDALGKLSPGAPWWERVGWTALQAGAGALAAVQWLDMATVKAALMAAIIAAANAGKIMLEARHATTPPPGS